VPPRDDATSSCEGIRRLLREPGVTNTTLEAGMDAPDPKELRRLAQQHVEAKSFQEALDAVDQSLALEPDSAAGHSLKAVVLSRLNRPDDAVTEFREAARLEPGAARHQINLAMQLRTMGRSTEALAAAQEALRIQPDHAAAQQLVAQLQPAAPPPQAPPQPPPPEQPPTPPAQPVWDPIKRTPEPDAPPPQWQPVQQQPYQAGGGQRMGAGPVGQFGPQQNTSGGGPGVEAPYEIKKWNWGAFLLTPIWALAHRLQVLGWAAIATHLIPTIITAVIIAQVVPQIMESSQHGREASQQLMQDVGARFAVIRILNGLLGLTGLVLMIVAGASGNVMAWKARRFESIGHFFEVQGIWTKWGVGVLIAYLVLCCCGPCIVFMMLIGTAGANAHP
jgi:hypothetical protein